MSEIEADQARLDQPVWYAAYGSNLSRQRFLRYIQGGPIPGSTAGHQQDSARDQSLPTDDQPFAIDRTLFFAGSSNRWGDGGVAFLDADTKPSSPAKGRAWRITLGQLEDLFRQENGQPAVAPIALDQLQATGSLHLLDRWYGRVELLGEINRTPVITIASPDPSLAPQPAHVSYLSVIAEGLADSWSMDHQQAAKYLAALPGNAGNYSASAIATDLASSS